MRPRRSASSASPSGPRGSKDHPAGAALPGRPAGESHGLGAIDPPWPQHRQLAAIGNPAQPGAHPTITERRSPTAPCAVRCAGQQEQAHGGREPGRPLLQPKRATTRPTARAWPVAAATSGRGRERLHRHQSPLAVTDCDHGTSRSGYRHHVDRRRHWWRVKEGSVLPIGRPAVARRAPGDFEHAGALGTGRPGRCLS